MCDFVGFVCYRNLERSQVEHCWFTQVTDLPHNVPDHQRYWCWDTYTATFDAESLFLTDLKSEPESLFRGELDCGRGCGCSMDATLGNGGGIGQGCSGEVIRRDTSPRCWSPTVQGLGQRKREPYLCPNEPCIKLFDPQHALDNAALMGYGEVAAGTVVAGLAVIGLVACCGIGWCMKHGRQERIVRFVGNNVPVARLV